MDELLAQLPAAASYRLRLARYSAGLAAFLERGGTSDEVARLRRTVRDLLEKLDLDNTDTNEQFVQLMAAARVLRDARDLEASERFSRNALTLAAAMAAENGAEPAWRRNLALSHWDLATVLHRGGRLRESADRFRQALTIHARLAAEFPEEPAHRLDQASMLNYRGIALRRDEPARALPCHEQAIALCDKLVEDFPALPRCRAELSRSHFSQGIVLAHLGQPANAVLAFERARSAYVPGSRLPGHRDYHLQFASIHNEWAWLLATCADPGFRDAGRAVALARKAVELEPEHGGFQNTLGVALYRGGKHTEARAALARSMQLRHGGDAFDWLFLAMAHRKSGNAGEARRWYDRAIAWLERNKDRLAKDRPQADELRRFRSEAEEVLGLNMK
jgi:tetratricopeptide (TPR) repeat protein